jgi:hypothetical protein
MDFNQLTTDQLAELSDEDLADLRDLARHNATIIENRSVISDDAHRTARLLRALHHASEHEMENRQRPPDNGQNRSPSLAGFIAFAELFPADRSYNWVDFQTCPVAKYAQSLGLNYADVSRTPIPSPTSWTLDEPFTLDYLTLMAQPHTYGAVVDFAKFLISSAGPGWAGVRSAL